jgi:predicted membrane-bound spermidine synthase
MESECLMWSYALYFIVGGTLVTAVAYVGKHGDGMSAAFVASLPVLFIINVFLLYQNGGVSAGMSYARGALAYLPMFVGCVLLTMVLLPRIGLPLSMLAGVSVYAIPAVVRPFVVRRRMLRQLPPTSVMSLSEVNTVVVSQVTGHAEESGS